MLGGVVAPPPSASSSVPSVNDIIECFDNNGEPVTPLDLVPVAMVRYTLFCSS